MYKMLWLVPALTKFGFFATVLIKTSPDFTRDYGIKSAISSRYRFLRETLLPKASFWVSFSTVWDRMSRAAMNGY